MTEAILNGLNDAQRSAVTTVRGPVCILAGAGSGKTTTITRRIAYQVATNTFAPENLLAVTFTDRAAGEMRERLMKLKAAKVRARTFHAEALAQVAFFEGSPKLLPSKVSLLTPLVKRLPAPYKFRGIRDVAAEIERARNLRITPERYLDSLGDHEPTIPADLMVRIFSEYEARKRHNGLIDFEDLLECGIRLMQDSPEAAERIRTKYLSITVDEYQDVNLLQATLLDEWLGGRDDICVVGDDYQSIYGFTGAGPQRLLDFPRKYKDAKVVTLEHNYRSQPRVLEVANRLVPNLGGTRKVLKATLDDGPEPHIGEHTDEIEEMQAIIKDIRRLSSKGIALEEMCVIYRINARSEDYEEAFKRAGIAVQVRDGAFLTRSGPRSVMNKLSRLDPGMPAAMAVRDAARSLGWEPDLEAPTDQEAARQADLERLVRISEEDETLALAVFLEAVRQRFAADASASGVVLTTYHRAKGLEWDAVFLPRLESRELPFSLSKTDEEVAEERRLLYVGMTRARQYLRISWTAKREGKTVRPSRFIQELIPGAAVRTVKPRDDFDISDPDMFKRLRNWRKQIADKTGVPAYVVFHDATLRAICDLQPSSLAQLGSVAGVGPTKLARYGSEVLEVVKAS